MESLYLLIPLALVIFAIIVAALFWAVRSGQFDDLEREGTRILFDDDLEAKDDQ
jgi:cbb3-type cytochrome oxidase maturation protein